MASRGSRGLRWSPKVLQNAACAHAPSLGRRGECVEPRNATVSSVNHGFIVIATA